MYGGDLRTVKLAELYAKEGRSVYVYAQEKYYEASRKNDNIDMCKNLKESIDKSEVIVSSIPLSRDKENVNTTYSDIKINLKELQSMLTDKIFVAGNIPTYYYENKSIKNIDLLQNEELTILNAIPTVEGTIKIAIEETECTIHESNVLIYGYGRIGKMLCKKFQALGANVYCVARKEADLAWIREERCFPLKYEEIAKYAGSIDIIINTVPVLVVKEEIIKELKKECVIIDIASKPGGIDENVTKKYNIKHIVALGIPGKIAPLTAAKYIKKQIDKLFI